MLKRSAKRSERHAKEAHGLPAALPAADLGASDQSIPAPEVVHSVAPKASSKWKGVWKSLSYIGLGKERSLLIQNLSTMLGAGLPLVDSLKTLQLEMRHKTLKQLLGRLIVNVENGSPLWRAMDQEHFFSPDALALVRIGEESGSLAENMEHLSAQQEKDQALRGQITMAMIYPSIVLVLMFVIVMGLGLFVLPNLIGVLLSLHVTLPLVTRLLIGFTQLFSRYGIVGVPSIALGVIVLSVISRYTRLQVVTQWIIFHIPGIGRLMREATIARFGVILGGLLQAGVPLTDALHSLVEVTSLAGYKRFYRALEEHVILGDSFAKSFSVIHRSDRYIPPSVQQLVMTGERTGSLATVMLKIADIYEKKANETAQKLPVILEPMLLLIMGALVATIALAIVIPIYSIVGNIG